MPGGSPRALLWVRGRRLRGLLTVGRRLRSTRLGRLRLDIGLDALVGERLLESGRRELLRFGVAGHVCRFSRRAFKQTPLVEVVESVGQDLN